MFFLVALLVCAPEITKILTGLGEVTLLPFHLKHLYDAGIAAGKLRARRVVEEQQVVEKGKMRETITRWMQEEMPEGQFHEVWQKGYLRGLCSEMLLIIKQHERDKLKEKLKEKAASFLSHRWRN